MRVSYVEGLANHSDSESCLDEFRVAFSESSRDSRTGRRNGCRIETWAYSGMGIRVFPPPHFTSMSMEAPAANGIQPLGFNCKGLARLVKKNNTLLSLQKDGNSGFAAQKSGPILGAMPNFALDFSA
jgi:hypothetical protein